MGFFGLLLLLILIWFVVVPLFRIGSAVNKARKTFREAQHAYERAQRGESTYERKAGWSQPQQKRKRIDPSVGEYVKFQEVKLTAEELRQRSDGTTEYSRTTRMESQVEDAEWEDIK